MEINKTQIKILIGLSITSDPKVMSEFIGVTHNTIRKHLKTMMSEGFIAEQGLSLLPTPKLFKIIDKPKEVDPRVNNFYLWWKWAYWRKTQHTYKSDPKLDNAIIKRVLKSLELEEAKYKAMLYFKNYNEYSLRYFEWKINSLIPDEEFKETYKYLLERTE